VPAHLIVLPDIQPLTVGRAHGRSCAWVLVQESVPTLESSADVRSATSAAAHI
tara:strand:- start:1169 stop:1327 length:159 start_codon:yes stop_codon:yes gene_type:complete